MKKIDWNAVEEAKDYSSPEPGGYIATIVRVEDVEDREYLRIEWDFVEPALRGSNSDTYQRAGFWPYPLIRSYKPRALPFFKAFKTALEKSNPGYQFSEASLQDMCRRQVGLVLAEEEYQARDGRVKTRLYVASTHSVDAIKAGDYKVPALKKVAKQERRAPAADDVFTPIPDDEDDGQLPF